MDYNINNYYKDELLEICGFNSDQTVTPEMLNDIVTESINKFHIDDPSLAQFFYDIRESFKNEDPILGSDNESIENPIKNEDEYYTDSEIIRESKLRSKLSNEETTNDSL